MRTALFLVYGAVAVFVCALILYGQSVTGLPSSGAVSIGGGGATIPETTHVLCGDGEGNGALCSPDLAASAIAVLTKPAFITAISITPVLTAALPACAATTGPASRASVSDATTPALGVALTGGGGVFANVHCSLTTGTYIVDGL